LNFQILLCVDVAATSAKSGDMCRFLLDEVSIISCAFCMSILLQILLETSAGISYIFVGMVFTLYRYRCLVHK